MHINVETGWKKRGRVSQENLVTSYTPPQKVLHTPLNSSWNNITTNNVIIEKTWLKIWDQESSVNNNFKCPSPPTQLHTAYYCPINYATAAAYASSSSRLRHKSMSSLSLPLSLPLLFT